MVRLIVVVKNKDRTRSNPNKCVYIQIYYINIYRYFLGAVIYKREHLKNLKKNTSKPTTRQSLTKLPMKISKKRPESEMTTLIHSTPNKREFQRNPAFLHCYQHDLRFSCHRFCWMSFGKTMISWSLICHPSEKTHLIKLKSNWIKISPVDWGR